MQKDYPPLALLQSALPSLLQLYGAGQSLDLGTDNLPILRQVVLSSSLLNIYAAKIVINLNNAKKIINYFCFSSVFLPEKLAYLDYFSYLCRVVKS